MEFVLEVTHFSKVVVTGQITAIKKSVYDYRGEFVTNRLGVVTELKTARHVSKYDLKPAVPDIPSGFCFQIQISKFRFSNHANYSESTTINRKTLR